MRPPERGAVAGCTVSGARADVPATPEAWDALYLPGRKLANQHWGSVSGRHGGGANCLFVDGRVRWLRREQAHTAELFGWPPVP
jgi:prepilin-type processing-associated H-X9-DG protein